MFHKNTSTYSYFYLVSGTCKGCELKFKLDRYVDYCNQYAIEYTFDSLSYFFHSSKSTKKKLMDEEFGELVFKDNPMVVILASFSEMKAKIISYEKILLEAMTKKVEQ